MVHDACKVSVDGIFARDCTRSVSDHKGYSPPASKQKMSSVEGFVKLAQRWEKFCQGQKDDCFRDFGGFVAD